MRTTRVVGSTGIEVACFDGERGGAVFEAGTPIRQEDKKRSVLLIIEVFVQDIIADPCLNPTGEAAL